MSKNFQITSTQGSNSKKSIFRIFTTFLTYNGWDIPIFNISDINCPFIKKMSYYV